MHNAAGQGKDVAVGGSKPPPYGLCILQDPHLGAQQILMHKFKAFAFLQDPHLKTVQIWMENGSSQGEDVVTYFEPCEGALYAKYARLNWKRCRGRYHFSTASAHAAACQRPPWGALQAARAWS